MLRKRIIYNIKKLKRQGITVTTLVDRKHTCMSACTLIFLEGNIRVAHEKSAFLFHTPKMSEPGFSFFRRWTTRKNPIYKMSINYARNTFIRKFSKMCGPNTVLIRDIHDGDDHY